MAWTVASVRVRVLRIALFSGGVCVTSLPSLLAAQTISPQIVEFDPSPDHARSVDGVAIVDAYELRFYGVGGVQPLQVIALDKPAPEADGKIRFNFASRLGTWPVDGVIYEARVAAIGPGGTTASAVSNQFVFGDSARLPSCSYTIAPTTETVGAAATTGSASVTTQSGCGWTATSSGSWLTITGGASGSGNGVVNYSVAANISTASRTANLTVGTASLSVLQSGACTYSLSPTTTTVEATAATGSVAVTAGSTCAWSATSSASWLSVTGGGSGSGNGTVNFSVALNTTSAARTATLTVGKATFNVTQNGACAYAVTPTSQDFKSSSGNGRVAVTVSSGCSWTATRSGSWITIASGASGSGSGTVRYRLTANTSTSPRTGTLTVAGQPVTITQSGAKPPNNPTGARIVSIR